MQGAAFLPHDLAVHLEGTEVQWVILSKSQQVDMEGTGVQWVILSAWHQYSEFTLGV